MIQARFAAAALALTIGSSLAQPPRPIVDLNRSVVPGDSNPRMLTRAGGLTFFTARIFPFGRELWRTDDTRTGTFRLTDLAPGTGDAAIEEIVAVGSEAWFVAGDRNTMQDVWVSDGTVAGTRRILVAPGPLWIAGARAGSTGLVFGSDRMWASDGTAAGTRVLRAFASPVGFRPVVVALGGNLYFARNDELWVSDGTASGTRRFAAAQALSDLVADRSHVYWVQPGAIWRTDGVTSVAVASIGFVGQLAQVPDRLFFVDGLRLLTMDKTSLNVTPLTPMGSAPNLLTPVGSHLFFVARDPRTGIGLWSSDGTVAGTGVRLGGQIGVSHVGVLAAFGNDLLYVTAALRWVLWRVPPGSGAPLPLLELDDPIVSGFAVDAQRGLAWFGARDPALGNELWRTDGTAAGTGVRFDLEGTSFTAGSSPTGFRAGRGGVYFAADDGIHGRELWWSDGTAAGTRLVFDGEPGPLSANVRPFREHGGLLYFLAAAGGFYEVWRTDGTAAGTFRVQSLPGQSAPFRVDVNAMDASRALLTKFQDLAANELWLADGVRATLLAPVSAYGSLAQRAGERVFFSGQVGSEMELFVTDGSVAGTRQVIDLNGSETSLAVPLAGLGGEMLFTALGQGGLARLFATDGTAAGTRTVFDNGGSFAPWTGCRVGGRVFLANAAGGTAELFVTDGTAAGTLQLAALPQGERVVALVELDGRLLFGTSNGVWRSDGTAAGTVRLVAGIGCLGEPAADGRRVYWRTRDPEGILASDGTAAGTGVVVVTSMTDDSLAVIGGHLVFRHDDQVLGSEPWILDLGATAERRGIGCGPGDPELNSSAPVLGTMVRLLGSSLPAGGVASLWVASPALPPLFLLGGRCGFHGDPGGVTLPIAYAGGGFDLRVPLPVGAGLAGRSLSIQTLLASAAGAGASNGVVWTFGR